MEASFRLDSAEVRRALRDLASAGPKAAADALNRTAFEILDGLEAHTLSVFDFAGPSTARFLGRGFQFQKASARKPVVTIRPRRRASAILSEQVFGTQLDPGERLSFDGKLAIPTSNVHRGTRGRVPKRLLPSEVVKPGKRGFVNPAGTAILQRPARGKGNLRVLYRLVPKATLDPHLEFFDVVGRVARREFPKKAARVLEKIAQARAGA